MTEEVDFLGVREYHIRELQPFGFVDGHDPDSLHVRWRADFRVGFIPGFKESVKGIAVDRDMVQDIIHE